MDEWQQKMTTNHHPVPPPQGMLAVMVLQLVLSSIFPNPLHFFLNIVNHFISLPPLVFFFFLTFPPGILFIIVLIYNDNRMQ